MREHHIYFPVTCCKNLLNALLRLLTWLLIGKPRQPVFVSPEFIDAVRSPDRDGGESFYVIDFPIHGEKNIRKRILHHDGCSEALSLMIKFGKRLRSGFMIAMDAQQGRGNTRRQLFCLVVAPMQIEVKNLRRLV